MPENQDFERAWLTKFSNSLDKVVDSRTRNAIMEGSEGLSERSSRRKVIDWSKRAMERLDSLVDEEKRQEVMTGCACQYPKTDLQKIRQVYETTGDVDVAHRMLQERFEAFLKNVLGLDEDMIEDIVERGWGSAGVKEGNRIIATKIPKSGNLLEYMEETDRDRKRELYCHCPRIRKVLKEREMISGTYCYCGAGFYKGIWEEILGESVKVEMLESVMEGDEVCKIAVYLP